MKKLPKAIRQFRKRGMYKSVRRSQIFRHRFHAIWNLYGRRMLKPKAALFLRDILANRLDNYLALANIQSNLLRKEQNLDTLYLRHFLDRIFGQKRDEEQIQKLRENVGIQRIRRYLTLLKKEIRNNFALLRGSDILNKKKIKPVDFRFVTKPRIIRRRLFALFKRRKFRRRNLNRIQRKALFFFKFNVSRRHRVFLTKKIFVRNRILFYRSFRKTWRLHRKLRLKIWLQNGKLIKKFKRKVTIMRARHVRLQRLKVKIAKSLGQYHKWQSFKVRKKWKYKLQRLPRRNLFLKKPHYKGKYRLKNALNAQYKGLVKTIPYFILIARKKANIFIKAGLRQIFRAIPIFARFVSVARVPHNGIRKRKVRRM